MRATATPEQVKQLWDAVRLCDQYFSACAEAWAKNNGKLVSESGELIEGSDKIEELCNRAAEAVGRLVHGDS